MFSKLIRKIRGQISLRLAAGFGLLLLGSFVLFFALAYWQLRQALRDRDRVAVQVEVGELLRDYGEGGLAALTEEMAELSGTSRRPIYFRLADADGHTLTTAGSWPPAALRHLEAERPAQPEQWTTLLWGDDEGVEVITHTLSDNSVLQAGTTIEAREEALEAFRRTYVLTAFVVLMLSLAATVLLSRRILRPLSRMTLVTRRIGETGSVDARVSHRESGDELDELARDFNGMLARIGRLLSGMRETLDHVAHDLRTPMTRLRMRAEIALQRDDDASCRSALEGNLEDAAQVVEILDAIMDEAEAEAGTLHLQHEPVALRELVDEIVDLYGYVAEEKGVVLETAGSGVTVSLDRRRMRQAIGNVIDNAIKYTPPGGRVAVDIQQDERWAILRIRDNGVGIAPDDLPRIWDRLYRGDHSRTTHGLGLGLSLVRAIVDAHEGGVEVLSRPGGGSVFTIHIPLERSASI